MRNATISTSWEAARFANVEDFIKQQALLLGVKCDTAVRKGWFMEEGVVRISGPEDKVMRFKQAFEAAIKAYNK